MCHNQLNANRAGSYAKGAVALNERADKLTKSAPGCRHATVISQQTINGDFEGNAYGQTTTS